MSGAKAIKRPTRLFRRAEIWVGQFDAMASPCEILMAVENESIAAELLQVAATEAWRIEQKYSRYRQDGIIPRINESHGIPVAVDPETSQLLDFAYQCYELSDGLFDITSGVLRKAWSFKTGSAIPSQQEIDALLPLVGLEKANWQAPEFTLPVGMQIDFGGIGKEYAVDRTLSLLLIKTDAPLLVNFGGDLACNRSPANDQPWRIGIEAPGQHNQAVEMLEVRAGGLATSGSTHRYLMHAGRRYGHILNPCSGWPIADTPLSVTVAAASCSFAGMLATFAMLQGSNAEEYLKAQGVQYWVFR